MEEKKSVILMPEETDEIKAAKESSMEVCMKAESFEIETAENFDEAAEMRGTLNATMKAIKTNFKTVIDPCFETKQKAAKALKAANALLEKALAPLLTADNVLKCRRNDFKVEQQKLADIELKRKEDEAKIEAAKEKERLDKEAEALLEEAKKLEDEGKTEQAEAVMEQAEEAIEQKEDVYEKPVYVEPVIEKKTKTDNGTAYDKKKLVVKLPETEQEIKAFCWAVQNGDIGTSCVKFSLAECKSWAKATGKKGKIHGMTITEEIDEVFRGN